MRREARVRTQIGVTTRGDGRGQERGEWSQGGGECVREEGVVVLGLPRRGAAEWAAGGRVGCSAAGEGADVSSWAAPRRASPFVVVIAYLLATAGGEA